MPLNPPVRITKKQRKATAFRERGKKSKGVLHEDTGRSNPAPGRPRRRRPSTGDNGEGHDEDYREDDEDANAVPAMEDQDQALAEMAGDTEAVSKKPDGGRPVIVRVHKAAIAVDSAAAQKKKDRDKDKKRRRRSGADEGGGLRPATKKARLARGSDEILPPPAREGDGDGDEEATRMSVLEDGEGAHGAPDEEGKLHRYILFVGTSYLLYDHSSELALTLVVEGNLKYTTTHEAIQNHFSQCGAVFLSSPPLFLASH